LALSAVDGGCDAAGVNDSTVIELFRALGDPVRWKVVTELGGGARCACDLGAATGVAPSLLSHHLGVLRDAGVVTSKRRGKWIDYTLVGGVLEELAGEVSVAAAADGRGPSGAGSMCGTDVLVAR
jgi:ArsR family transcriptional regulator